jgi:glycosyltransferase involved in cell wall biosynthesis
MIISRPSLLISLGGGTDLSSYYREHGGLGPLRIVHLVASLEIGGLERLVVDLAREQRQSGHEVSICCLRRRGPLAEDAEAAGIPVTCFNKTDGIHLGVFFRLSQKLRQTSPDVVHTHNTLVHHYGALAAKLAGRSVVINTCHGLVNSRAKAERIFRATLPLTNAICMVSDSTRQLLVDRCFIPQRKTAVILNGIATEGFTERPARPGSARPRIRFGTIGRLVPIKDHATLLRAFAIVARQLPQADLHIAGDGPEFPSLKATITEASLEDRVTLTGATNDSAGFLSRLDIFVLSSLSEGLPVVILEAMASGLPIVSTRVGGTPEAAPEGVVAWYCPPASPVELAEVMLHVARHVDLRAAGEQASRIARLNFSITSTAARYEECYRSFRLQP